MQIHASGLAMLNRRHRIIATTRQIVSFTVASCILGAISSLSAAPPTLTHLYPAGGKRGTKVETTCIGSFDWPIKVWAPGLNVSVGSDKGRLSIEIPDQLTTDRAWVRIYNAEGTSSIVPFLIGSFDEVTDKEPNNSPSNAQELPTDRVIVNGILKESADVDAFAIDLEAGQTLVASVDAHDDLGSPMDSVLQIVSAQGTVLAENHDNVGLDPQLVYTAKTAGRHVVRFFAFSSTPNTRIALQNGDTFIYRLTITTGPFISHTKPLVASLADLQDVKLFGWNLEPNANARVIPLPGGQSVAEFAVEDRVRHVSGTRLGLAETDEASNAFRVLLVPRVTQNESDQAEQAAGKPSQPVSLKLPTYVSGHLVESRQEDAFKISLKKDQTVLVSVESHSLGSQFLPTVRLIDPQGGTAAEVDRSGTPRDLFLTHKAKHSGDYRLELSDRFRLYGEKFFYRLTVRLEQTDFRLLASAASVSVAHDKPTEFPISIQRFTSDVGPVEAIRIEVLDLPEGVTAETVVSTSSGESAKKVSLKFKNSGVAFSGPIRIRGIADSPVVFERFARTPARLGVQMESIWLTTFAKP